MPVIDVEIDEEGNIEADYKGFRGLECKRAEKDLLKKIDELKIKKTGERLKPEAQHDKRKRPQ